MSVKGSCYRYFNPDDARDAYLCSLIFKSITIENRQVLLPASRRRHTRIFGEKREILGIDCHFHVHNHISWVMSRFRDKLPAGNHDYQIIYEIRKIVLTTIYL